MSFLDPVMNPLLTIPPFWALLIITFIITLAVTLVYKYTTDQNRMKELKEEQKKYQKEMKELRADPEKMLKVQKKAMQSNLEYMKHSFKSTIYTLIPILLLFSWLNTHFAYYPIQPGQSFTITATFKDGAFGNVTLDPGSLGLQSAAMQKVPEAAGTVQWKLKATQNGEQFVTLSYKEESYKQKLLITTERDYLPPEQLISDSKLAKIRTDLAAVQPFGDFSLFGWHPGWFATYIILSLILTTLLRKIMNVY
jgi:uncharacterized membrane protein (DUF106 family)